MTFTCFKISLGSSLYCRMYKFTYYLQKSYVFIYFLSLSCFSCVAPCFVAKNIQKHSIPSSSACLSSLFHSVHSDLDAESHQLRQADLALRQK